MCKPKTNRTEKKNRKAPSYITIEPEHNKRIIKQYKKITLYTHI